MGRVQGVGFRSFVCQSARGLGLTGEVWNRRDGSVEVYAEAWDADSLAELETALRKGPGRVDGLKAEHVPVREMASFEISQTR
jgi:acylphosphatase